MAQANCTRTKDADGKLSEIGNSPIRMHQHARVYVYLSVCVRACVFACVRVFLGDGSAYPVCTNVSFFLSEHAS